MTAGAEIKFIGLSIKTLFWPLIALYFYPIYDWIMLTMVVKDYSLLTPNEQAAINDFKLIGSAILILFAAIKLIYGTYKIRQEIAVLKKKEEEGK